MLTRNQLEQIAEQGARDEAETGVPMVGRSAAIRYIVDPAHPEPWASKAEAETCAAGLDRACPDGAPHTVTAWVRLDEAVRIARVAMDENATLRDKYWPGNPDASDQRAAAALTAYDILKAIEALGEV